MPDPVSISMLARQNSLFENVNSKNIELNSERKVLSSFPFFPLKMDINISGACNLCLSMKLEAYNAGVIYLLMKPNEDETVHSNLDPEIFHENVAATAGVVWLCACIRYWPDRGNRGVDTCVSVLKLVLFKNIDGVALNRVYIVEFCVVLNRVRVSSLSGSPLLYPNIGRVIKLRKSVPG